MDPPTSPPTIISFIDGKVHDNNNNNNINIHRTRRLSRSSHPSEPEPVSEPKSVQHDLLQEDSIQKHQHQQPLQYDLHEDIDHDDDNNNDEHNALHDTRRHHQHLQTNHNIVNNEELSQMIAQKMLTTKTTTATTSSPASTSTNRNYVNHQIIFQDEENAQDIKFHSIPQKYLPVPWEQEPPENLLDYDSHPNGQVDDRHHHYHQIAPPSPSYYLPRNNMQEPSPTATNDDDDDIDDNNTITSSSRTGPTTHTTTTTKSVTFRTHDEVHQFDEQLEVLKYVDEEFFLVAHYLLEVVDFEDCDVDHDQYYHHNAVLFGNEADDEEYINSKSCTSCFGVGGDDVPKKRDIRCGGAGLLSRLLFGCGLVLGDDDSGIQGKLRNNDFKDQKGSSWRGYQLSTKLVSNFVSALNFRMENIQAKLDDGEEVEDEDDLVVKTREVARKINTYGLPMMIPPPSSCEGVTTMTAKKKIGSHEKNNVGKSRHFPVLPLHKDDNDVDEYNTFGVDENDRNLDNRPPPPVAGVLARHESSPTSWSSSNSAPPLSSRKNLSSFNPKQRLLPSATTTTTTTANVIHNNFSPRAFISSSLFQPKSTNNTPTTSTTSEAACKKRLARISHEIHKATSMMHRTQHQSVRHACSRRISKLRYERRLYQIIQERYNIQCMMATTRVESVRVACSERMKQLVLELEYLKHTEKKEEEEEEDRDDDDGGAEYEERWGELLSQSYPTHNNYVNDDTREEAAAVVVLVDEEEQDNNQWYDRVLKYVHGLTDDDEGGG